MTTAAVISKKLLTGMAVPALEVKTLGGETWNLADQRPKNYTAIVFYRGLHCPLCQGQLTELEQHLSGFSRLGIEMIAISGDTQERAQKSQQEWGLKELKVGYNLNPETMREWGLYLSKGAFENEPALFNEPAIFLVKPCGQVAVAIASSTPFARPHARDLIDGIDYILQNNYPTRGTEV